MKKLALVTDAWAPQINGVVRTLQKTVECLNDQGIDVSVIEPSAFKTVPCPTYPEIPLGWDIWKVGKLIKQTNPDYLHISTEGPLGLGAKLWADRHHIPYTTSYHTKYPEYFYEYFHFGRDTGYRVMRWFHKKSKAVLVNTESMRMLLAEHGMDNLKIWDRGVDTELFRPDGPVPVLYAQLPKPIVLNVGRVSIEKNLTALYETPVQGSIVQVGGGPMLETYKKLYPHVHFVGPKSGEELASWYRGADVFAFPSLSDTYGLVMLESIASGVPVAAFPVDGPKDVVQQGFTGALDNVFKEAIKAAATLKQNDLRGWAMTKSWHECTKAFADSLVQI